MKDFHMSSEEDIKSGKTTDVYFENTMTIFEKTGEGYQNIVAEFTASSLPKDWEWGVFVGLDEFLSLLKGKDVDVYALPEGTIFRPKGVNGVLTPVIFVEGPYKNICVFETPLLGFICYASGVATKSARIKKAAGKSEVMSFGIRRMHPAIAPVIDRSAYIGGCDSISCIAGAEEVGIKPKGTMPHALTIVFGDPKKAFKAFDESLSEDIARIALVDTYYDETFESFMAAEAMGDKLFGVRLDTPSSRRGDLVKIVHEVKWELESRGINAKIITSGGMNEYSIPTLKEAGVDAFGVGTSISNARTVNYAMDIVEKEGELVAKRGKFGGKKQAYRCPECYNFIMKLWEEKEIPTCKCGAKMEPMLKKFMEKGKLLLDYPSTDKIKRYVTEQLKKVETNWIEG